MRISDWSSDVCSSDLHKPNEHRYQHEQQSENQVWNLRGLRRNFTAVGKKFENQVTAQYRCDGGAQRIERLRHVQPARCALRAAEYGYSGVGRNLRSDERRGGTVWDSTGRSGCMQYH